MRQVGELAVRPYDAADEPAWDALVASSCNGTFLHTRRFLSYHGDRFVDRSVVVTDSRGRLRGVLPAADDPAQAGRISSHPGLTYGGLVHDGSLRGEGLIGVFREIASLYAGQGADRLWYKCVPSIHHRVPAQDDLYAFFRLGAARRRCDLSVSIDMTSRPPLDRMRRKRLRRAAERGVELVWGWADLPEFWSVLRANLQTRYGVEPTHSLTEMALLADLFPSGDEISLVVAKLDGRLVGGGVLFCSRPVVHMQYSATDDIGKESGALDAVVEACIARGLADGYRIYDFGNSNEQGGWALNSSLYEFKLSFGGGGVVYEHYELDPKACSGP
jgi:hypothetical protein